jgi:hypothetical protein
VAAGFTRPPILVLVLAGAFLLLVASLLIGSMTTPEFPPYPLTQGPAHDSLNGLPIYTLDASQGDRWRRFHFAGNRVVDDGELAWDIAFRRNHIIAAPGAGVRDLGAVSLDSLGALPADGYITTRFAADTVNAGIGKWYSYSMLSHLLSSKRHVYALRAADGRLVAFEVLAYYCRDVGAACYTMRYKNNAPPSTEPGARN